MYESKEHSFFCLVDKFSTLKKGNYGSLRTVSLDYVHVTWPVLHCFVSFNHRMGKYEYGDETSSYTVGMF